MALPSWLVPLPDAEAMRACDRFAIETRGIAGLELMERAGTAVARAVERIAADGVVTAVCGKGNNGGDGLVAARLLRETGREVHVLCVSEDLSGDARSNLERLPGEPPVFLNAAADGQLSLGESAVFVDALLGTGFTGEPRGVTAEAIAALNRAEAPVVSVDMPSGVDASSGVVSGAAVCARATVTFHAAKPGVWIAPGKTHAGEVEVVDIGIPRDAPLEASIGLIAPAVLQRLPRRGAGSTKFSSGHVLIAGGSRGLTGAPLMSAHASMRAGAGYVTGCVPASLQAIFATRGPVELMTRGLADEDGALASAGVEEVLAACERGGSLALGPGLGGAESARKFARELALRAPLPLVIDADGLNAHAHAGGLETLAERGAATVLTPHAGELARLLQREREEIERERLRSVREAAQRAHAVVVLKGDDTLVASAEGEVAVSPGASAALATAGTGDVLSGVIAALLAQGLDAFEAAAAGVLMHVLAGREAARRAGSAEGVIASDVIEALPLARAGTLERAWEPGGRLAEASRARTAAYGREGGALGEEEEEEEYEEYEEPPR
jgi:ADP-dependent NAD(P)H-hydrate dehydratase / NAD(P)H-hydrate epimerase